MHWALRTTVLSVGTVAHTWVCTACWHVRSGTLAHVSSAYSPPYRHVEGIHVCALCTRCVHTSPLWQCVSTACIDTPSARLLCRHSAHTRSTRGCILCFTMYCADTYMSSIYKTPLYTEFTHPVCSNEYKAHARGHTQKHSMLVAGVALCVFCVHKHSKLCNQASPELALRGGHVLHESVCTLDTMYHAYTHPEQKHSENTPCLPAQKGPQREVTGTPELVTIRQLPHVSNMRY